MTNNEIRVIALKNCRRTCWSSRRRSKLKYLNTVSRKRLLTTCQTWAIAQTLCYPVHLVTQNPPHQCLHLWHPVNSLIRTVCSLVLLKNSINLSSPRQLFRSRSLLEAQVNWGQFSLKSQIRASMTTKWMWRSTLTTLIARLWNYNMGPEFAINKLTAETVSKDRTNWYKIPYRIRIHSRYNSSHSKLNCTQLVRDCPLNPYQFSISTKPSNLGMSVKIKSNFMGHQKTLKFKWSTAPKIIKITLHLQLLRKSLSLSSRIDSLNPDHYSWSLQRNCKYSLKFYNQSNIYTHQGKINYRHRWSQ